MAADASVLEERGGGRPEPPSSYAPPPQSWMLQIIFLFLV